MATVITASNFKQEILEADVPVLVDFWADWCMPCRMLSPVVDELSAQAKGYKVAKINIDSEPELAQRFGVMSIPTLILFHHGEPAGQLVGVQSKEALEALIQQEL